MFIFLCPFLIDSMTFSTINLQSSLSTTRFLHPLIFIVLNSNVKHPSLSCHIFLSGEISPVQTTCFSKPSQIKLYPDSQLSIISFSSHCFLLQVHISSFMCVSQILWGHFHLDTFFHDWSLYYKSLNWLHYTKQQTWSFLITPNFWKLVFVYFITFIEGSNTLEVVVKLLCSRFLGNDPSIRRYLSFSLI